MVRTKMVHLVITALNLVQTCAPVMEELKNVRLCLKMVQNVQQAHNMGVLCASCMEVGTDARPYLTMAPLVETLADQKEGFA